MNKTDIIVAVARGKHVLRKNESLKFTTPMQSYFHVMCTDEVDTASLQFASLVTPTQLKQFPKHRIEKLTSLITKQKYT